jgi:hypothetical protein
VSGWRNATGVIRQRLAQAVESLSCLGGENEPNPTALTDRQGKAPRSKSGQFFLTNPMQPNTQSGFQSSETGGCVFGMRQNDPRRIKPKTQQTRRIKITPLSHSKHRAPRRDHPEQQGDKTDQSGGIKPMINPAAQLMHRPQPQYRRRKSGARRRRKLRL